MKKLTKYLLVLMIFVIIGDMGGRAAVLSTNTGGGPVGHAGKKWRIGYCETESFSNYSKIFYYLVKALAENGWLKNTTGMPFSPEEDDTDKLWAWLAQHDLGDYIEFPANAHYNLARMQSENGPNPEQKIIDRLNHQKDIDLMIVMGTKAGQALGNNLHQVPVFVFSASNAFQAGIVKGVEYSGNSHVWAHMDMNRFKRQLQVFHDLFKFKKLGIVYENSQIGKSYTALTDIEAVAKERGFQLIREYVNEPRGDNDIDRYRTDLKNAYLRLAPKVNAFYLTVASVNSTWLPDLLTPFYNQKVPVFSQLGDDEVQHGALMSITYFDYPNMGRFGADALIKAMSGSPLDKLNQSYENTPQIIINLEVARKIGYKPAFDILLAADKVYRNVVK